jgi:hypothetical protein
MKPPPPPRRARRAAAAQLPAGAPLPAARPAMFEIHIRPMFRSLDREHMSFALNLWKYFEAPPAQQEQFYRQVLNRLKAADPGVVMPPPDEGGPWPPEWLALFERWINEGMRRLDRATADASTLQAAGDPASGTVTITAAGTKPSAGHVVWIERSYDPERLFAADLADEFVLYQEQRVASAATPTPFSVSDFYQVPAGLSQVTVVDSGGKHVVPIT